MKPNVKGFSKIEGNTTSHSMNAIEANARKQVDQDIDLVLLNLKIKTLSQTLDEVLLMIDRRYKH